MHYHVSSYLKGLVPDFNTLVDDFLEKLKPLADGQTVVPLKDHIRKFSLSVLSKVQCSVTKAQLDTACMYP